MLESESVVELSEGRTDEPDVIDYHKGSISHHMLQFNQEMDPYCRAGKTQNGDVFLFPHSL